MFQKDLIQNTQINENCIKQLYMKGKLKNLPSAHKTRCEVLHFTT